MLERLACRSTGFIWLGASLRSRRALCTPPYPPALAVWSTEASVRVEIMNTVVRRCCQLRDETMVGSF